MLAPQCHVCADVIVKHGCLLEGDPGADIGQMRAGSDPKVIFCLGRKQRRSQYAQHLRFVLSANNQTTPEPFDECVSVEKIMGSQCSMILCV